jgi:hypothetical protein
VLDAEFLSLNKAGAKFAVSKPIEVEGYVYVGNAERFSFCM